MPIVWRSSTSHQHLQHDSGKNHALPYKLGSDERQKFNEQNHSGKMHRYSDYSRNALTVMRRWHYICIISLSLFSHDFPTSSEHSFRTTCLAFHIPICSKTVGSGLWNKSQSTIFWVILGISLLKTSLSTLYRRAFLQVCIVSVYSN